MEGRYASSVASAQAVSSGTLWVFVQDIDVGRRIPGAHGIQAVAWEKRETALDFVEHLA